jgi:hypothetical protein
MQYAAVQNLLLEDEFTELLEIMGSNREKFRQFQGRFCNTGGSRYCIGGDGYCDPSWCHDN